jgi:hypothetical protein
MHSEKGITFDPLRWYDLFFYLHSALWQKYLVQTTIERGKPLKHHMCKYSKKYETAYTHNVSVEVLCGKILDANSN